MTTRQPVAMFGLIGFIALLLYVPFLAIQYDTNGIEEAQSTEAGRVLNHNHMAYRPLGFAVYRLAQLLGYSGKILFLFQLMNAVSGALAVGFCYLALQSLLRSRSIAIIASLWWATTFIHWYISTDVAYMALAAMFAAAAVAATVCGITKRDAILAGLLTAMCIFTWQAGVFLVAGLAALWLMKEKRRPLLYFIGTAVLLTLGGYAAIGVRYFGVSTMADFLSWTSHYGAGEHLVVWGQWTLERLGTVPLAMARSLVPTPLMVGPGELLQRRVQLGRIAIDIAFAASIFLFGAAAVRIALSRNSTVKRTAAAFLAGVVAFVPFFAWWDPEQAMWWAVPNIFVTGLLAMGWDSGLATLKTSLLFAACTAGIALSNFVTIVRPRHADLGPARTMAACVAEHTSERDLIIAAEWGWPDYMGYLHHRYALNLINSSLQFSTKADHFAMVESAIDETQRGGGLVVTRAPESYSTAELEWLESQTRITGADLQRFRLKPGFTCDGLDLRIVERLD